MKKVKVFSMLKKNLKEVEEMHTFDLDNWNIQTLNLYWHNALVIFSVWMQSKQQIV